MTSASTTQFRWLDRSLRAVMRHWLLILNGVAVLYAALPWIAPLLQQAGFQRAGRFIFGLYSGLCHQLPERSFFVDGYQVCYCHGCTALYTTIALVGVLYVLVRWKTPLATRLLLVLAVPMLIDGLWHMANDLLPGLHLRSAASEVGSVNFWARMVTGTLCGLAALLWLYPRCNRELANV